MSHLESQNIELIIKGLRIFFPKIEKKALVNLAKAGCYYKESRINDVIYHVGSSPTEVYLLIEGNMKL